MMDYFKLSAAVLVIGSLTSMHLLPSAIQQEGLWMGLGAWAMCVLWFFAAYVFCCVVGVVIVRLMKTVIPLVFPIPSTRETKPITNDNKGAKTDE